MKSLGLSHQHPEIEMRVFLAIDLPDHIRSELQRLQAQLPIGRPVPSDNLHLTLSFLGEQSEAACEDAHEVLSDIDSAPFVLRLAGLGSFGKSAPQVIYADVEACIELLELERKITRKLRSAGVQFQKRRFRPHVTIARLPRMLSSNGLAQVQDFIAHQGPFRGSDFQVTDFHFFRSLQTPDRVFHDVLASYHFPKVEREDPH